MEFFNIHFVAKQQKMKGGPLVSPSMVCYAEKQVKPFCFGSLGQMVQFGAIIFCRTSENYFGQFVRIEKKCQQNSRVSLPEAATKKVRKLPKIVKNLKRLSFCTVCVILRKLSSIKLANFSSKKTCCQLCFIIRSFSKLLTFQNVSISIENSLKMSKTCKNLTFLTFCGQL